MGIEWTNAGYWLAFAAAFDRSILGVVFSGPCTHLSFSNICYEFHVLFFILCIYTYIRRYSPAVSDQFALSPFRHQLSSYPDRQPAAPALVHTGICTQPGLRRRDVPSTQHPPVDCAAHARSGGGPGLQVRQEHQQTGGCIFWLVLLFEEHQQVRTSSDFCLPCLDSLQNINRQMSTSSGLCCCLKNINR